MLWFRSEHIFFSAFGNLRISRSWIPKKMKGPRNINWVSKTVRNRSNGLISLFIVQIYPNPTAKSAVEVSPINDLPQTKKDGWFRFRKDGSDSGHMAFRQVLHRVWLNQLSQSQLVPILRCPVGLITVMECTTQQSPFAYAQQCFRFQIPKGFRNPYPEYPPVKRC